MVASISKVGDALRCKFQHLIAIKHCEVETEQRENIVEDIERVQLEIKAARSHFDFQTEFELIDADIYHLNELEARYNYLIKKSKAILGKR